MQPPVLVVLEEVAFDPDQVLSKDFLEQIIVRSQMDALFLLDEVFAEGQRVLDLRAKVNGE